MCVQGTLIYNRDSFLPNLRRPDCRGLSLLKGGQVLTTKGGGWFFFLSSSRSSRISTTDYPPYLFTSIDFQLRTLFQIQDNMATTVPANADLMAIVVLGVSSVPTAIEVWLMNREESTLCITAGHLIDSNV